MAQKKESEIETHIFLLIKITKEINIQLFEI